MRRARKTWAQIAEEQAQFQAIDQKPPGWTAGKKAHAQSEQQVARAKARISGVARAWLATLSELRNQASLPSPLRLLAFYGPLDTRLPAANFPESALLA